MGDSNFWGIELSQRNREVKWVPPTIYQDDSSSDDDGWNHKLHVRMATLGKGVSKTEEQIVEVEAMESDHTAIRIPFVNMTSSAHNTILTSAIFSDVEHVTFRLISGDGPIYLSGCVEGDPGDDDYSDLSSSSFTDDSSDESSSSARDDNDVNEDDRVIMKTKEAKRALKTTAKRKSSSAKSPPKRGRKAADSSKVEKKGKTTKSK